MTMEPHVYIDDLSMGQQIVEHLSDRILTVTYLTRRLGLVTTVTITNFETNKSTTLTREQFLNCLFYIVTLTKIIED